MSTDWGYYCATCNVSTDHWWNRGDDQLALLAKHWPQIKPVYELTQRDLWRVELRASDWYDPPSPLEFLVEHGEHQVMLENEYGERRFIE